MAGPGICVLCLADTCTSAHPVAPYGYLLFDMYLFMADITNPDVLELADLDWSRYHPLFLATAPAIQRVRMVGMPKNGKSGPHCWGREVRHNLHSSLSLL